LELEKNRLLIPVVFRLVEKKRLKLDEGQKKKRQSLKGGRKRSEREI